MVFQTKDTTVERKRKKRAYKRNNYELSGPERRAGMSSARLISREKWGTARLARATVLTSAAQGVRWAFVSSAHSQF